MRSLKDEDLKSIFSLKANIEMVFFKAYIMNSSMPKPLNFTHAKTLIHLFFRGAMSMSDISRHLNLEKGSFTPVANILIKMGYVSKIHSSEDRRIYNLELTEKGYEFAKAYTTDHVNFVKEKLTLLSDEEKEAYFGAIYTLIELTEKLKD